MQCIIIAQVRIYSVCAIAQVYMYCPHTLHMYTYIYVYIYIIYTYIPHVCVCVCVCVCICQIYICAPVYMEIYACLYTENAWRACAQIRKCTVKNGAKVEI